MKQIIIQVLQYQTNYIIRNVSLTPMTTTNENE